MSKIRPENFTIDRGIDSVVRNPSFHVELPQRADVPPPDTLARPQLEQLLTRPNIDEYIARQLLPAFDNPAILTPARFQAALVAAQAGLRSTAETRPNAARALGRAARVLKEEVDLRELLQIYRSALLQG